MSLRSSYVLLQPGSNLLVPNRLSGNISEYFGLNPKILTLCLIPDNVSCRTTLTWIYLELWHRSRSRQGTLTPTYHHHHPKEASPMSIWSYVSVILFIGVWYAVVRSMKAKGTWFIKRQLGGICAAFGACFFVSRLIDFATKDEKPVVTVQPATSQATHVDIPIPPVASNPSAVKAKPLTAVEERSLIAMAQNHITADGSTVLEVLRYAERMRKNYFKVSSSDVFYNDDGTPSEVVICYFSGPKHVKNQDEICDINFSISADHKSVSPRISTVTGLTEKENKDLTQQFTITKLMLGRSSFLASIDDDMPSHHYSMEDAGEYGYERAISDEDKSKGRVTNSLVMVRFLGEKNDVYSVEQRDGESRELFSCKTPCEYVKIKSYFAGSFVGTETMKNERNSVIGAIMADAQAGVLKVYSGK